MTLPAGLLLLTGGRSSRFGGPKHAQAHPAGGTWGSHLVDTFLAVFPGGPVQVLGLPLTDRPALAVVPDEGLGPARALAHWAAQDRGEAPLRWWVVACDQVRWTPETLAAWHGAAEAADPGAGLWVLAQMDGQTQYLGGFLAGSLVPRLAGLDGGSLWRLARALPHAALNWPGACWLDVDTPEALAAWLADRDRR